jgi:hypothetical protein
MKRTPKLLVLSVVFAVFIGAVAGTAVAASSPTVVTAAATSVTDTTAVLNGEVNPNGSATAYVFSYGPTTAYGAATPAHSAGRGVKTVDVARTVTGLTPGTIYHYRISASNGAGSSIGADRTFTTTGHPPAAVITGGTINVGQTVATPTGSINPEGALTSWVVEYGLSTAYGYETQSGNLAGVDQPLAVSALLAGLSPETLFHYRLVAYHGGSVISMGADATFFTEPATRLKPNFSAHTSPSRAKRSPYTFTTTGTLGGAGAIPALQRCSGNVGIRFYNGRRQLAFVVAPVGTNCDFSVSATFRRLFGKGVVPLKVTVDYRGTGYVAPATRTDHVTAG